jgi:uncharacterized protein (TIGR02391 family)
MVGDGDRESLIELGRVLSSALPAFSTRPEVARLHPTPAAIDNPLAEYDRRITDQDLRLATRSRFGAPHYSDAIEAGVKALNECVRKRSGSREDGDGLMTSVFSVKEPKLRVNRLRSDSERSEQRGHMMLCQGVVAAWRNPRAHSNQVNDSPDMALMMLELIQHLIEVTKGATKTRVSRKSP